MAIKLICIGKNKDDSIRVLAENYLNKIKPYVNIKQIVLPDTSLTKTNTTDIVIRKESERLLNYLAKNKTKGKNPFVIVLDKEGKMFDSLQLARILSDRLERYEIIIIIGGVYGISEEVKEKADLLLSISKLTFTHRMVRIIILEQIYRSLTIISNKKYHY